jgi:hypothetical protein
VSNLLLNALVGYVTYDVFNKGEARLFTQYCDFVTVWAIEGWRFVFERGKIFFYKVSVLVLEPTQSPVQWEQVDTSPAESGWSIHS